MAELPAGTVTFLFTDLVSSTRLWEDVPAAMRGALADHDRIMRDAIEAHDGHVVKGTGDGVHAAFATATDGVAAALDAQLALGAASWSDLAELQVRMGLHSGVGELRDGDYYGSTVNRAARLMSAAHGGQIVVSPVTEELVRDFLPEGVSTVDLGEHRLRDLASPMRVFQLVHPDLERDFPRLRSVDAFAGNLPVQLTSFVGRDDDLAHIVALLGESSLVTLIGTGGVGKTRLAIQAAAEVLPEFADGAWFCELAAADDGESMAQIVAAALGCVQRAGLSPAESIVEFVKVRELLLVLDNCEHLLDEAEALTDAVLRSCPQVTVLATSREALEVGGERVVRVRSLDAPAPDATGDAILGSAAVRLFVDRAADAAATDAWTPAQWEAVGEICRRVDGIPLAIELAAARVASMSPIDIAAHLDERFRLLTGKRRGRVERHQTLRATVEWSYQLLDPVERTVFDRLGVFAGTFDAAAAEAIAGDEHLDDWQIIDSIASLVAKSMLVPEPGPDDSTRYAMYETLRQFARERLDEAGDTDVWRRRHAEHYAAFCERVGDGCRGPDELAWALRLIADLDNVRAAVGWALDRDEPEVRELAVRVMAAVGDAAAQRVYTGLDALAPVVAPLAEECRPALRASVLSYAAYYEMNQGRPDRARALGQAALRDGVVVDALQPFFAYFTLGYIEISTGNYRRALEVANEARALVPVVGDHPYAESRLLSTLAMFEAMAGEFEEARRDAARSLELALRVQNPTNLSNAWAATGWSLLRDDPAGALEALERGVEIARRTHTAPGAGFASNHALIGSLRSRRGDNEGALDALREAVIVARDQGTRPQVAAAFEWSLAYLIKIGHPEAAATLLGALSDGVLAEVSRFPEAAPMRARIVERLHAALADETIAALASAGATMSFDEVVAYALEELAPA